MREKDVYDLLANKTEARFAFRAPKKLVDYIMAAGRLRYGARKDHGLKSEAFLFFAAYGALQWMREHGKKR